MKNFNKILILCLIIIIYFLTPSVFSMTGGKISGNIYYNGDQVGTIRVIVVSYSPQGADILHYTVNNINKPGPFTMENLTDGLHFIGAFMDVDGNNLPHYNEPCGFYRYPIYISQGKEVTNVDFPILDLPRGTASIEGKINYTGCQKGHVFVIALGLSFTPITITSCNLEATQNYQLNGLAAGKYIVAAFLDANGNVLPGLDEPFAIIRDIITIERW